MDNHTRFLTMALTLAKKNVAKGGRPFAAIVVKQNQVIAQAVNRMRENHDPTAHAELLALRQAGEVLQSTHLEDCVVYASGQPCPMCLAAIRMCGIKKVVIAYSNEQAAPYGLSTAHIATELSQPIEQQSWLNLLHLPPQEDDLYQRWQQAQENLADNNA